MKNVLFLLFALMIAASAHLFFNISGKYAFSILLLVSIVGLLSHVKRIKSEQKKYRRDA